MSKFKLATSFLNNSNWSAVMFLTGNLNSPKSCPTTFMYAFPTEIPPYLPNKRIISIDFCCKTRALTKSLALKAAIKS